MTLSERLNDYKNQHNLSAHKLAERLNINHTSVCHLLRGDDYTPKIADAVYQALGEDYKRYIKYSTCAVCGEQYIPKSCDSVICSKPECLMEHRRRYFKAYEPKNKRKYNYGHARKKLIIPDHKPKVKLTEYNEKARQRGLSYGELQGRERMLMGMEIR